MIGFKTNSTQYSVVNAYWLAQASRLAYRGEAEIKTVTASWGLDRCEFISETHTDPPVDTQVFVAADDSMIVVAFRGTENILDWITNAKVKQKPGGPLGKIHGGFLAAFQSVWGQIHETIEEFDADSKPRSVWVTGHSLGGALATITAAQMIEDDDPIHGMYTYGQPRVGDRKFAREFDGEFEPRAFRHVNSHDIVTRVPPRRSPGGDRYRHIGSLKYFDAGGDLHDDINWWNWFLSVFRHDFDSLRDKLGHPFSDHDIDRYVALLKALAERDS